MPDDTVLDGGDRWAALQGNAAIEPVDYATKGIDGEAYYRGDWKLVVPLSGEPKLFNLANDTMETTDLAARHAARVADMQAGLASIPRGENIHQTPWYEVLLNPDKFGAIYTRRLKRKHQGYGDTFCIDEVFVKINGRQHYLWRAVDQDGEVVDVFLQARRDGAAAKRFFKRLLRSYGGEPRKIVTDKLRSYGVAHRELIPEAIHSTRQFENNRAEQSHEATRVRERGMRRFKSVRQAQRFLGAHPAVSNLLNLGRHHVRAKHYRNLRISAFADWSRAVA